MMWSIWKILIRNDIELDEKSYKNVLIWIMDTLNGYFEEINGKKYLTLVLTNESKEK